jgi:hypothetical protein
MASAPRHVEPDRPVPPSAEPSETPSAPPRAAKGIILALLLSAPVWLGLGVAVWRLSAP